MPAARSYLLSGPLHLLAEYAVASEVFINLIGLEWWAGALAGSRSDSYFTKDVEVGLSRFIPPIREG
jgi:hypothetical protein